MNPIVEGLIVTVVFGCIVAAAWLLSRITEPAPLPPLPTYRVEVTRTDGSTDTIDGAWSIHTSDRGVLRVTGNNLHRVYAPGQWADVTRRSM